MPDSTTHNPDKHRSDKHRQTVIDLAKMHHSACVRLPSSPYRSTVIETARHQIYQKIKAIRKKQQLKSGS